MLNVLTVDIWNRVAEKANGHKMMVAVAFVTDLGKLKMKRGDGLICDASDKNYCATCCLCYQAERENEELEEALSDGIIERDVYELARQTAEQVVETWNLHKTLIEKKLYEYRGLLR